MITKKYKFSIPEYRAKKDVYAMLGYQEVKYAEKGINCVVTFHLDETTKYYKKMRKLEREIYPKGPPFSPIIAAVAIAFILQSVFVILIARSVRDNVPFDLLGNSLSLLLPSLFFILTAVAYTVIYFKINSKILTTRSQITPEFIREEIGRIKQE